MPKRVALTDSEQEFAEVTKALESAMKPKWTKPSIWFIGFMMVLMALCISLGVWQVKRLDQKLTLIARVEQRINAAPISLPPIAEWSAFDAGIYDFHPVELTGTYVPDETVLVFTNLVNPNGKQSGVGYWVVAPFKLSTGGTVFVNRGFVPETSKDLFGASSIATTPQGQQTIIGIARASEVENTFTPGPDKASRIEYVRSVPRLTAMMSADLTPIAPIYVNANATVPNALPQGGETKISFPNRHTEYALTWFSLAGVIIVMTGLMMWRRPSS